MDQNFLWLPAEREDAIEGGENAEEVKGVEEEEEKEATWEDQPVKDKLITALTYLRNHYSYCLHCGHQVHSSPFHH